MKLAITGLANSGKTTLFNALTGQNIEATLYATTSGDPHVGVVKVPDERVVRLSQIYEPRKTTFATVEYIDYIGIAQGDQDQNRLVFDLMKGADALVCVIRAFNDDSVVHPNGNIDPQRDLRAMESELILSDLELIEKRLDRMAEGQQKKGKKPDEGEKRTLEKCREYLENEIPLRNIELGIEEARYIRHLQFISILPMIVVLNISEDHLAGSSAEKLIEVLKDTISHYPLKEQLTFVPLSGKIEMEISQLDDPESEEFLKDLGITEPARNRLIHESYKLLGLISFLTVGEDEVRAWTISSGTEAHKAAGKIHSDIERGFIRAEVVSYSDLIELGSMTEVKQKGLSRLEGKNYIVRDGDIINFRFNV
ncbi:MAG: redox-regulated ATPase YchF [Nitrospirota bacterium]|nr:MAG: redox-regulated ATPase YchF [Nitrospirota bacterium]